MQLPSINKCSHKGGSLTAREVFKNTNTTSRTFDRFVNRGSLKDISKPDLNKIIKYVNEKYEEFAFLNQKVRFNSKMKN